MVWLIAAVPLLLLILVGRPAYHIAWTVWQDRDELTPTPVGFIDDASRQDLTPVREIWPIPTGVDDAERQLVKLLAKARADHVPISIAGAKHSMGGHVIAPDGIVIDMLPFNAMELDEDRDVLQVQAGATWDRIIPFLDARGRSVIVMQSNSSFSVGGSISVNCHGWQYGLPPIASTVDSLRLMNADGEIVRCSRTENAELFSLTLGGYGLFGVILDVDLRVTRNERLRRTQEYFAVDEAFSAFDKTLHARPDTVMLYGRLNVTAEGLLTDMLVVSYAPAEGEIPQLQTRQAPGVRRAIFRGSAENDYGKRLRWRAEKFLLPHVSRAFYSRNELLNEGVEVYQNRSAASTDILHEYFIPQEHVAEFLAELRRIVPAYQGDLLNVTVRYVDEDTDVFLRYANTPMFAFVMLFTQDISDAGESTMAEMTREMIEAALACEGRYYLPYRLHATVDQFEQAYPMAREFFDRKRHYDPDELFTNEFYQKYSRTESGAGRH